MKLVWKTADVNYKNTTYIVFVMNVSCMQTACIFHTRVPVQRLALWIEYLYACKYIDSINMNDEGFCILPSLNVRWHSFNLLQLIPGCVPATS